MSLRVSNPNSPNAVSKKNPLRRVYRSEDVSSTDPSNEGDASDSKTDDEDTQGDAAGMIEEEKEEEEVEEGMAKCLDFLQRMWWEKFSSIMNGAEGQERKRMMISTHAEEEEVGTDRCLGFLERMWWEKFSSVLNGAHGQERKQIMISMHQNCPNAGFPLDQGTATFSRRLLSSTNASDQALRSLLCVTWDNNDPLFVAVRQIANSMVSEFRAPTPEETDTIIAAMRRTDVVRVIRKSVDSLDRERRG